LETAFHRRILSTFFMVLWNY